jgi:hypothetical protein
VHATIDKFRTIAPGINIEEIGIKESVAFNLPPSLRGRATHDSNVGAPRLHSVLGISNDDLSVSSPAGTRWADHGITSDNDELKH